jgi:parallel beta-helix repeat protein
MGTRDTIARRMALVGVLALGGALLLESAGPAAAATHLITRCPYRIAAPGTYVLTRNLICPPFTAIEVAANDVTLVLGRHTIDGQGQGTLGVFTSGKKSVTGLRVLGGTLVRYGTGIWLEKSPGARVVGVGASGNLVGIFLLDCSGCVVIGNRTDGNAYGIDINRSNARIIGNTARGNEEVGIDVEPGSAGDRLIGNTARGNGTDLFDHNLPGACANVWRRNRFATDNETGAAAGPGKGCIR